MTPLTALIIFIVGTAIGSFLSVATYRIHHKKKGIILSRSFCPHCKKKLKWRHLIPIFSWVFLKGKCAYCGKKISSHYLFLELLTGIAFLTIFLHWNFLQSIPSTIDPSIINYAINWQMFEVFLFYIIEFTFLIAIFFYDMLYQEIPDSFSLPAIGVAIAGGIVFGTPTALSMLIGAVILGLFFLLQFVLSKGKWIGGGDIRMGVLMGVLLGWEMGILALALSYFIGAIFSLILMTQKKVTRKSAIALGPFLIMGTTVVIFWGEQILNWYLTKIIT